MDFQVALHQGHEHARRLRFLSGVAWSNPDALFRRVGLAPGMNCLDVRCGAGQVTLPMARLAGASGRVLGIDPEAGLLEQARDTAACQGVNAEFQVGDIADLKDRGAFDLVYTRFLLTQGTRDESEETLRRMVRLVRPGGTIVVEDMECLRAAVRDTIEHPAYTRFLELFQAVVRAEEEDVDPESRRGSRLPDLLEHAGVSEVHYTESPTGVAAGEQSGSPVSLMLDSIRHAIVAAHLATRTEVNRLASELDRFELGPQSLSWLPRIVQVWGSVPALSRLL